MAESIFTIPKFGSNYQQLSNPAVPQAPNLNFGAPGAATPSFPGAAPNPTVGPLSNSQVGNLNAQGTNYSTPAGVPTQDTGFSFGEWADIGTGLVNAYTGYEGLKLGKDQFGFAKDSFNKNLANQAQLINNQQEANQRARLETSGQYTGEGGQASLQQDLQSYLKPRQVSGAPI